MDLPGYGPSQVEVRLFQYGQLSAATIGSDGKINGLNGTFVLQVRKITTATATTIPLGCLNLVLLGFDGHLTYNDVGLTTHAGGAGRIPPPLAPRLRRPPPLHPRPPPPPPRRRRPPPPRHLPRRRPARHPPPRRRPAHRPHARPPLPRPDPARAGPTPPTPPGLVARP